MITKSIPARARTRTFAIGVDYITEHTHQRAVAAAGVKLPRRDRFGGFFFFAFAYLGVHIDEIVF